MANEILFLPVEIYLHKLVNNTFPSLNTQYPIALSTDNLVYLGKTNIFVPYCSTEDAATIKTWNVSYSNSKRLIANNVPNNDFNTLISAVPDLLSTKFLPEIMNTSLYNDYTKVMVDSGFFINNEYLEEIGAAVTRYVTENNIGYNYLPLIYKNTLNGYYMYQNGAGLTSGGNWGHVWDNNLQKIQSNNQASAFFTGSYDDYFNVLTYDSFNNDDTPHFSLSLGFRYGASQHNLDLWRNERFINDNQPPLVTKFLTGSKLTPIPTDPYSGGGTSVPGGGSGTFDGSSSEIELPATVPAAGALNSGFIKVFNPSAANVTALAAYLWGTFDIQSFKSIYNNPIDCIIALLVVPVAPTVGAAATISLGNVATSVSAPVVSDQFVIFDCGSLDIREYWGAYLDYDPYTKVEIYLPYIGVRDIDVNDIQGKTVHLKYYIDVLSGSCVAMLQCGPDVLYSWSGQCAAEIPITSTGFGSVFQTALSAGNAIGETIVNAMSGIPQNLSQVASSVFNGARSKVHKSGSLGSMAGHMGIQTPYLIITRPQQSVPEDLNNLTGYPSNMTATLSDLSGYTEIDVIYLENIPATSAEMDEIEQLLKDGVIL